MKESPGPWSKRDTNEAMTPQESFRRRVDDLFRQLKHHPSAENRGDSAMLVFASYFLQHPFAEFHEAYAIDSSGDLLPTTERDVSLVDWAESSDQRSWFTGDDLRRAAARIQERFPELHFDFAEDRMEGMFSYTARLSS